MRKLILVFAALLLCIGAWAQDEYIEIDRTFDLTCMYPEDWNDMSEPHMFAVYGTYSHPYNRSGRIECMVDYSDEWMDLSGGMLQPGDEVMSQFSATLDSTETWHIIQFRIIDAENETIWIEPFDFVGIREYHFSGIEDKVYTGEAQTQENVNSAWLYPTQYQITNYRNNIEIGTAYFDIVGVYPFSIGRVTLSFQILDANDPEWALLQDLRAAVAQQGNENWVDWYWPADNGFAGVSNWSGVTMSEGHVAEMDLTVCDLHLDSIPQAVFRFPHLWYLNVSSRGLTGNIEDIVAMTDIPCAASLSQLDLNSNLFTGNIGALAQRFPNLSYLNVAGNKITEVIPMISPNVTDLWMYSQQIDSIYALDFRVPLSREGLMATLPSLMLYNHSEQAYVKDNSFTILPDVDDYDAWYMYLYAGQDTEYLPEFSVVTWHEDPAYRYNSGDTLYMQGNEGTTCRTKIFFKLCDADFSGTVDIADLQMMLNYILGGMSYSAVFNLTATDLYRDSIMNVQDVVRMVDTLLTHEVPVVFEAPCRVATETADAALYWKDGDLHLYSSKAVASMQIHLDAAVNWQLTDEWMKGERKSGEGTNVVIYSLNGATFPAETDIVIAHSTNEVTVRAAALSDPAAKRISIRLNSPAVATGVESEELRVKSEKFIRDGQLFIIRGNKMYNAQGIEL